MGYLKELRTQRGWSVDEVAKWTGVGSNVVYKWESGRRMPSAENIYQLAACFGLNPGELFMALYEEMK